MLKSPEIKTTVRLEQITDQEQIRAALKKDDIYLGCYQAPRLNNIIDNIRFDTTTSVWFKVFDEYGNNIGLLLIKSFCGSAHIFHGGIYKEFRGKKSPEYVREALQILKNQYPVTFITTVLESNKAANKLVTKMMYTKIWSLPILNDYVNVYTEIN